MKKELKDILVPVDFNEPSFKALMFASSIAKKTKARDITDDYLESNLKGIESILIPERNHLKKGEYELAIEEFTIGLKQYPDNITILMGLIDSYKELGNNTKVVFYNEYKNEILKRTWGDEILEQFRKE